MNMKIQSKYQVEVHAEEDYGQDTIDRFITK